jgi:outer membrane protein assembly factor BamB
MSRTIPAVDADFVVTIGPKCHVMCVDRIDGGFRWGIDLVEDFGAVEPLWYTGQCPLIDDGVAVLAVGGEDLLIGVDCSTGGVVWRVPNRGGLSMSHSSIMIMNILGKRTYVYCAVGGIVGISAEEADLGDLLWQSTGFDAKVIAPSPVNLGDGRVFVTAGYGAGSILLEVSRNRDGFSVETVSRTRPNEGFSCEQQTPLVIDGLLYGIVTKDAGPLRGQFVCYNPEVGVVWSSGEKHRFGLGPYLHADGKFIILSDEGVLSMIDAGAAEYRELSTQRVLNGVDAWAPMALAGGLLILRDSTTMACLDLRL